MKLKNRIEALHSLGKELQGSPEWLEGSVSAAFYENKWFTPENTWKAIHAIGDQFLNQHILESWVSNYPISDNTSPKKIGLVLAGNIPLVGFHDILSTFVSGHISMIKCSSKDAILLRTIIGKLTELIPESQAYFEFSEQLKGFDAVIATGSNNSARYFEQYFGKYPNIIRKNRNAIGILDGSETKEDILALGQDIFTYFGLGCRNVSKIYVPKDYSFDFLLETLHEGYKEIANHNKYKNNFDYNNALFLLNKVEFLMSGSLILTESKNISSRISTLHYERYEDVDTLSQHLDEVTDEIQCVVSKSNLSNKATFNFGSAQKPSIADYADGVDTMEFLNAL